MNVPLACALFVLLGVAGSFAGERIPSSRYRRSNINSASLQPKENFVESDFSSGIFKRDVTEPSQVNEVESTVSPLKSSDLDIKPTEKPATTPTYTTETMEPSSSTDQNPISTDTPTTKLPDGSNDIPSLGSRSGSEPSATPKPNTNLNVLNSKKTPSITLNPPFRPGNGYLPPYPSFPDFGAFDTLNGAGVSSFPGYSSQGFLSPDGSGFASTFNSGFGNAGSFAGSFAGAGTPTGFDTPTFLNRGGFVDNGPVDLGFSSGPGPNPFPQGPSGSFGPGFDFQQVFDQYFRNIQAQNEALQQQIQQQQQTIFDLNNRLGSGSSYGGSPYGGSPYGGSPFGGSPFGGSPFGGSFDGSSVPQTASASISIGPQGGFQTGDIGPTRPGIESRFAESIPPINGGKFAVFSSSSSHQAVAPNGEKTSYKAASTGVNDNGKVTFRTVHDP